MRLWLRVRFNNNNRKKNFLKVRRIATQIRCVLILWEGRKYENDK